MQLLGRLQLRGTLARYAFAVAAVAIALGFRIVVTPLTGTGAPFVVFFGGVLVTSLLAGTGPALLVLVVSLPLAVRLFVLPEGYPIRQAIFQALLYAFDGLIVMVLSISVRRWQERIETANGMLHQASLGRERALMRAQEIIDLAPDAYFLADLSARFIDVNQAACRLLGYERDELIHMRIYDLIRSEDNARLESQRAALLVPGTVLTTEWVLKRKNGTFVEVEVSSNILRDGRWEAFVRDITERRRVTTQLRESEARFRLMIEEAPIGMALVTLDGGFAQVNRVLSEITGYTADELERLTFQDITHPDDLAEDLELTRKLARGDIPRFRMEKRYIRKDGAIVEVVVSRSVLRGAGNAALYYITQIEDVTAQKRADEALRRSEAKFSAIISISADAIITIDEEQRIAIFNKGAEEIFGYSKEEVVGTPLERLIPERFREAHRAHVAAFAAGLEYTRRVDERRDVVGLRKSGEEFPAQASIARLSIDGATVFSAVLRDISYRKRVEDALKRAVDARDRVLGVVAHDLRNPLGVILMEAEMLERPAPETERRDPTPRQTIVRAAHRMNRLIQDLLDVTRAEADGLEVQRVRLGTRELVREIIDAQLPLATASRLALEFHIADDVPDLYGDHDRLLQVFENLVGNAIKFTPPGGCITVSAAAREDVVRFSVADTGAGIPAESIPHIFDRFWQGATEMRHLGAGLGLPITRDIVLAHGGEIWVESVVGQGSTFFFTIPIARTTRGRLLEPKPKPLALLQKDRHSSADL